MRRAFNRSLSAVAVAATSTAANSAITSAPTTTVAGSSLVASCIQTPTQVRLQSTTDSEKPATSSSAATEETKKADDDEVVVEEESATPTATDAAVEADPVSVGEAEEMAYKTETRQLLDIVACSLYSDKEVFIRELVSNASDALEKRRQLELSSADIWTREDNEEQPSIHLTVNQSKSRFIIRDTGLGMTKEELSANLGTIASSGSKSFVQEMQKSGTSSAEKIIGQFGVGFYSVFMIAKYVRVYSKSGMKDSKGYMWESDGTGTYKITEMDGLPVGTKIVLDVKDTELGFCTPQVVERVIKKYSNFINFDISLNGGKLNTVEALWMKSRNEVSEEDHMDFYKFISGAYDSPLSRLHYIVDAPMSIRALLYLPQSHSEKYGSGRMESGINLYCRRVLIQSKAKGVLPEWLRFIKGAVDSESIPLNVSREHTQDSSVMRRLNSVLTKRILKWFDEESRRDKSKYEKLIKEYGSFLKEGVCTDQVHKMDIAKLLRFETTKSDSTSPEFSLTEYCDRMLPNQSNIYFINAPSKDLAAASPYFEAFKEHDIEVIVCTDGMDDFVMQHLDTYAKHKIQNIETFDAAQDGAVIHKKKIADGEKKEGDQDSDVSIKKELSEVQCKALSDFIQKRLVGRVGLVKATTRLRESPGVIADHESAQMRKLYKMTGQFNGPEPKHNFQFNPQHDIIRKCYTLIQSEKQGDKDTAGMLVEQLFDNAIISAGLLEDPRVIVGRLNSIMSKMVENVEEPKNDN